MFLSVVKILMQLVCGARTGKSGLKTCIYFLTPFHHSYLQFIQRTVQSFLQITIISALSYYRDQRLWFALHVKL